MEFRSFFSVSNTRAVSVPIGPCSECPDPPSTAHIHPAFLNLSVRCEQGMIDEVDVLCQNFIAAFKEVR